MATVTLRFKDVAVTVDTSDGSSTATIDYDLIAGGVTTSRTWTVTSGEAGDLCLVLARYFASLLIHEGITPPAWPPPKPSP